MNNIIHWFAIITEQLQRQKIVISVSFQFEKMAVSPDVVFDEVKKVRKSVMKMPFFVWGLNSSNTSSVYLSRETTKTAEVIKLHDDKLCFSVEALLTKKSLLNLRVLSPVALWRHSNSHYRSHAH